tara:strand:- start:86 stop:4093 length:4008 start_codon:yes stop_codon:yes gene_type:complete
LENPFYSRLGSVLWVALVLLIVTLAAYVSLGRLFTANLASYRVEILQALNARLPFGIEAQQVSGEWQSFTPALVLTGLRISIPGSDSPPLELSRGRMAVDVLNSLRTQSLQMSTLVLDDLLLRGELSRDGKIRLSGFGQGEGQTAAPLREFILNVERISLRNNRLMLTLPGGEVRDLGLDLELAREGSERHVQATLASSAGARIAVVARGLGNPFTPQLFSGQLYLDMQSTDLGAVRRMLADRFLSAWTDGTADLQLWLNWDRGTPSVAARLESGDLLVAADDDSWQLPLQRLAVQARLLQRENGWTLFLSNLHLAQGDVEWTLPRAQLDTGGSALRLRTGGFALAPINTILTEQAAVPESLREVFTALQPRGQVSALQFDIDNTARPADDWQIAANFEDVAVDSLHGAPGVRAATGYARITPTGGVVVLDGQAMSLDFPAIYSEPLEFEDLYGTLNLDWDAKAVRLASGLLTTRGEEGVAKVLFGLNIPLQPDDTGIEMGLLVGLHDTHPVHRAKYIPYILDPSLLSWLADSIGDGDIQQGAFLWRGSLRSGAAPLRTVQLAFNVSDTQLRYHPQWPPVSVEQGVVLIDDSNVSVWAERASLYQSRVNELSVETRLTPAGDVTLDLQGAIQGPVGDGFRVLNESPLAQIVGPTFAAWTATGHLDTQLQLHMNLSDASSAPRVDVATRWRDVELLVTPGNLPLQSVNGEFEYSTETGFSSSKLAATLWGNAVTASLRQHHGGSDSEYDPATTVVDIELATRVELADVRRWLQLERLSFASGRAAADMSIRLAPGVPPVLTVSSDLQGVSLDLPAPWQKQAHEPQQLRLAMPLATGVTPLSIELGEQLRLRLDIDDGAVRGGALGINEPAAVVEEGLLRITGFAPLIQADEWLALAQQYFGEPEPLSETAASAATVSTATDGGSDQAAVTEMSLKLIVDDLRADRVVVLGRELQDVVVTLSLDNAQWEAALVSQWLRGQASRSGVGSPVQLTVEYLDLDQLPAFEQPDSGSDPSSAAVDMPALNVSLRNLFQSERRLGELDFTLHKTSDVITVEGISGELALLRLPPAQPAQLVWHQGVEGYTELQATLAFDDLGQTLEFFDYQRIVETGEGEFDVTLRWPGGPQDFSLPHGQGALEARIGHGSFLEAPASASGALRVVSILNLADIVQRLSLSNMFEAGIPFDSVQGEIDVRDGLLTVSRMDVEGGSSFRFSGISDLRTRSLDGQLVATIPVANNLPWIAALAASLPVAAGVFVVSQVFNKQMNRLSSAVYSIGGNWNDPEVTFDRIFDNTPHNADGASSDDAVEEAAAPAADGDAPEASSPASEPDRPVQSGSP